MIIDLSKLNEIYQLITYSMAFLYGGSVILFGVILYKISKRM